MSRLIDAELLKEHISSYAGMFTGEGFYVNLQAVLNGIDFQPTIQPQGIDKDRLIEFLKKEYGEWKTLAYEQYEEQGHGAMSAIGSVLEWIDQHPTSDGWIPCSSEDRLTEREDEKYGIRVKDACNVHEDDYEIGCFYEAIKRLMYYEDLAEQGRLAYLPQPYKEGVKNE